jgi:putative transposase
MFKPIKKEIKDEILSKIKSGVGATMLAKQYGISSKTIYGWISKIAGEEISVKKYNRLRRENEELKRLIGIITLDLEREKKRKIFTRSK